jgi:hypothetical protein
VLAPRPWISCTRLGAQTQLGNLFTTDKICCQDKSRNNSRFTDFGAKKSHLCHIFVLGSVPFLPSLAKPLLRYPSSSLAL